jgi:hypothetical protein
MDMPKKRKRLFSKEIKQTKGCSRKKETMHQSSKKPVKISYI